jgi:hypothetical protein
VTPGYYVMRRAASGTRFMLESRCFKPMREEGVPVEWTKTQADQWAEFVQSEHPNDDVFVMQVHEKPEKLLRKPDKPRRKATKKAVA